jgi:hypothetical protein
VSRIIPLCFCSIFLDHLFYSVLLSFIIPYLYLYAQLALSKESLPAVQRVIERTANHRERPKRLPSRHLLLLAVDLLWHIPFSTSFISPNMATIKAQPFKLALIQLGNTTKDKTHNLSLARSMVLKAAKGGNDGKKPDLIVLPVRIRSYPNPYRNTASTRQRPPLPSVQGSDRFPLISLICLAILYG